MTRPCERCGTEFEALPNGRGRPRHFCSGCRDSSCDVCDKPIRSEHERCLECLRSEAARQREERWQTIASLLEQGCSDEEIGARFGWKRGTVVSEVSVMRSAGWAIPYRRAWDTGSRKPATLPTTKQGARNRLNRAVRIGEVVRPPFCEGCGSERAVEGHHHDYSKPFEVEWLCRPCHSAIHNEEREAA